MIENQLKLEIASSKQKIKQLKELLKKPAIAPVEKTAIEYSIRDFFLAMLPLIFQASSVGLDRLGMLLPPSCQARDRRNKLPSEWLRAGIQAAALSIGRAPG
jgi:hypothetical protein